MYTLECTVLFQMSGHFVRMLIIIISGSNLKLGHVGSKTRLLGQWATQVSNLGPLWPSCFSEKIRLDVSSESSARQRIHRKKSSLIFFER